MRLFFKDQAPLLWVYFGQLFFIILVFWLAGPSQLDIMLYAILLSTSFLIVYLVWRYVRYRDFYQRLSKPMESLDESIWSRGSSPLSEELDALLATQYRLFQGKLHNYEREKQEYVTFINQWVHQMKTPLSVMNLMLQEEEDPRFEPFRDELDKIGKGLETVLYNARLEVFDRDFLVQPVSLQAIVREVLQKNKRLFIRNRVDLEEQVDSNWQVESDEKWLSFVLGQLITNAVRYSRGRDAKVSITAFPRGSHVVLEVKDQGVGIPQQDLPRLFDPYFTGENGRLFAESTGMGLYLVRRICQKLGHKVELESKVGEGTIVRVVFSAPIGWDEKQ